MNYKNIIKLALCMVIFTGFSGASDITTDINKEKIDFNKPYLTISLVYNYEVYKKPIFFKPKAVPTYVIWVREIESDYLESIFLTRKAAENKWTFTSKRPEVIPVWYGIKKEHEANGGLDVDAISAATPRGETVNVYWQIPERLMDKNLELFVEANNSFDFNNYYHKKKGKDGYSGANGQPSIIWKADFMPDSGETGSITPAIVGHGHVMGDNHIIHEDISAITTAVHTFQNISVQTVLPYRSSR